MSKNAFDAILTSAPLDATAAKVTARGEEAWKPRKPIPAGKHHWDAPPPMKPFVLTGRNRNMTGSKFGRFTVIGLLDAPAAKVGGARWVCRCVCGDYEARSNAAIRLAMAEPKTLSPAAGECWNCIQLHKTQNDYRKHGARPLAEFTNRKPQTVAKSPLAIIAEKIVEFTGCEVGVARVAADAIWADLCRAEYRIVRNTTEPQNAL